MVSNSSVDLEGWSNMVVKNKGPEVDIHSKDLAAFSESINKSRLQQDSDIMQGNGKSRKRKAWEIERKVEQEWRIVSVSRFTGGKDRHSKVVTAKGLRDRRVRLSVPTAIQVYDLQERLGYEQPSKAVDWLIKAAKSAIDELPVQDPEILSAGNVAQLTSSNYSNVDHCVRSPRKSATAATAPAFTAFRVGLGSAKAQVTNSHKAINGEATSIPTLKGSDLGRSSSSISNGSTKGSAEHTSNCSMSEPTSKLDVRLKESEVETKKLVLAKNSSESSPVIHQLKSMQPLLNSSPFKSVFPYSALPFESQFSKDDNPCGIHTEILSGTVNVQQLWNYNRLSYTDMLRTQDSQTLQNLISSPTMPLQMSFPPLRSTTASIQAVIGTSCPSNHEMADSAASFFDPKQSRPFGGNTEQGVSRSGLDQSISSSIRNMPSFSHIHKTAYGQSSANAAHDFVPLEDYEARVFHGFHYE